MPYTKIYSGKNRGKYKSPTGRVVEPAVALAYEAAQKRKKKRAAKQK